MIVTIHGWGRSDVDQVSEQVMGLARGRAFTPVSSDVLDGDGQPGELLAALKLGELGAEQPGARLVRVGAQSASLRFG